MAAATSPPSGSRSARVRANLLESASSLLGEVGFAALTMDAVAAASGSSKATLYRHWPSKASLAMDALMAEIDPAAPFPDTGRVVEDFRLQVREVTRLFARGRARQMLLGVLHELPGDEELRREFRARYTRPRRAQASVALDRGVRRGELRPDPDHETLFDQIYGALYLRLLTGASLTQSVSDAIVDQAFSGVLARGTF